MKDIYYKTGEGQVIKLIGRPYKMLTDTDLLDYDWEPVTQGINYLKISAFKKSLVQSEFQVRVIGSDKADLLEKVEALISAFDRDVRTMQPGRLYIGQYYKDAYIKGTAKSKIFETTSTTITCKIISEDGEWKNEELFTYSGQSADITGELNSTTAISVNNNASNLQFEGHTLRWEAGRFATGNKILFDLGQLYTEVNISDLILEAGGTYSGNIEVEYSNGVETTTTGTVEGRQEETIDVTDATTIRVDSWSTTATPIQLILFKYSQGNAIETIYDTEIGTEYDVTNCDTVAFQIAQIGGGTITSEVNYTLHELTWTTAESVPRFRNTTHTVNIEDIDARYIRVRNTTQGFWWIDSTDFIITALIQPEDHELSEQGYSVTGASIDKIPDTEAYEGELLGDNYGVLEYNAQDIELIKLEGSVTIGAITVQGLDNGEWTTLAEADYSNPDIDIDYDHEHYDKIRVLLGKSSLPTIEKHLHFTLSIQVGFDPKIYNDNYAPTDAIIKIYGPHNEPNVNIGAFSHGASVELTANQYLEINTLEKTVLLYDIDTDTFENVFAQRNEDAFEKVDTGESDVQWTGNAQKIEVQLLKHRSDPKWN